MGQPTQRIQSSRRLARNTVTVANSGIHQGHLVLINQDHPIRQTISANRLMPLSAIPDIHTLKDGMLLERTTLRQLAELLAACGGIDDIVAVSGYRTRQEQEEIYASTIAERGAEYTAQYVALPDTSEHQTGLAIDVGKLCRDVDFIAPAFPDTEVYKSFKQLAASYGFIQRYKTGKESITRISCEPWHFRYIGQPHAELMEWSGWCLEEYIDRLADYSYETEHLIYEDERSFIEIYYVPAEEGSSTTIPLIPCDRYEISGNNRDGFIVTAYRSKGKRAHV